MLEQPFLSIGRVYYLSVYLSTSPDLGPETIMGHLQVYTKCNDHLRVKNWVTEGRSIMIRTLYWVRKLKCNYMQCSYMQYHVAWHQHFWNLARIGLAGVFVEISGSSASPGARGTCTINTCPQGLGCPGMGLCSRCTDLFPCCAWVKPALWQSTWKGKAVCSWCAEITSLTRGSNEDLTILISTLIAE